MKSKLGILLLIPLLLFCKKEEEITPQKVVKVSQVPGNWTFDIGYVRADFTIEQSGNQLVIKSGSFTGKDLSQVEHTLQIGITYTIPSDTSQLQLIEAGGNHMVVIVIDSVSKDLTKMYTRFIGGTIVDGVVFQYNDLNIITKK
jgi:hypothetical protein